MPQIEGPPYLILFVWVMTAVLGLMSGVMMFFVVRFINKTDKKFIKLFSANDSLKDSMTYVKSMVKEQRAATREIKIEIKELKRRAD